MTEDKKRLLVVDDEVEICSFVSLFFEQRGFAVWKAYDGDEAVKVAQDQKPDVVLLDVKMKSDDDGFETLPKLKKILPESKILMVTGVEDPASVVRGKKLGAVDYITKPLILSYLEDTVLEKIKDSESKD